jgi:hypothetical protein
MKMRKIVVGAVAAGSFAALLLPMGVVNAAPTAGTTLQINITGGDLAITAPAGPITLGTGDLTSGSLPGTFSGTVGPVTVNDNRGTLLASWTVNATFTNWHPSAAGANTDADVPSSTTLYTTGAQTSGNAVFVGLASGLGLGSVLPVASGTGVGINSATWNPTVAVPSAGFTVADTYTATLTHSVTAVV